MSEIPENCPVCIGRGALFVRGDGDGRLIVCPVCDGIGIRDYNPPSKTGKVDPDKVAAFVNEVHRLVRENEAMFIEVAPDDFRRTVGVRTETAVALVALSRVEPVLLERDRIPTLKLYLEAAHALDAEWPTEKFEAPRPAMNAGEEGDDGRAWVPPAPSL